MYKNILITGKTGTVGSNLHFGKGLSSKECDLFLPEQTGELFNIYKPDAVVHCAAKVGGLDEHLRFKKRLFYDNIQININVIETARWHNVPRVLSFLSSCIYSDAAKQPYDEKNIHVGEPFPDYYPYGYAKRIDRKSVV